MPRLNNMLKFIIFHVNFLFSIMGLCFMGLAIYIMVANWGQLDPGFFKGVGAILFIAGFIMALAASMGNFGITHQRYKYGFWSGRRVLFIYQVVLIATLVAIIYLIFLGLIAINSFSSTANQLSVGQTPPFTSTEQYFANKFNIFYFGAAYKTCTDVRYAFFWPFINQQCSAAINEVTCQKCYDYSITSCVADATQCSTDGSGNSDPLAVGCPYTYCRQQILQYLVVNINSFSWTVLAIMIFAAIVMVSTCMLICYTERDSLDRQVFKSGTLANADKVSSGPTITGTTYVDTSTNTSNNFRTVSTDRHVQMTAV